MSTTPTYEALKERAFERIEQLRGPMIELSDRIGRNPELGFEGHQAVAWISAVFQEMGFSVECPFVNLETAFRARWVGEADGPNVGFLIEYDALPDLGHACGHNTKGSSTWGAVAGILAALPSLPGTLTVIGTPAEEGGGGKVLMADRGAFDDLDVALALTVGPTSMTGLSSLAVQGLGMRFWGRGPRQCAAPGRAPCPQGLHPHL
jgi:metal-dependent amidase/aminoacylase/carboxypeptidase family protein